MSQRLRLALIVSLAFVTAYGISFTMAWDQPHWSAFAISVCSLATRGESIFRGLQRLAGTVLAIPVALLLIGTLAQHRWAYGLALSLWLSFCAWRMLNTSRYYFWFCAGFSVPLLSMMSNFESTTSFYVVITRAQETTLGVICFIGYALLFSQQEARGQFDALLARQIELTGQRIEDIRVHAREFQRPAASRAHHEELVRGLTTLPSLHEAALLESFWVRERSHSLIHLMREFEHLGTMLDRLDLSFDLGGRHKSREDAEHLDTTLDEFAARIAALLEVITKGGGGREPQPIVQLAAERAVTMENPFTEGELLLRRDILHEIDRTTRELHAWALDIRDIRRRRRAPHRQMHPQSALPDPELVRQVAWLFMTSWAIFLLYIYVPALPDGSTLLILGGSFGLTLARLPTAPPLSLLPSLWLACLYGGVAHVFVMPHLSGFTQFAMMMFGFVFLIVWVFHRPEQLPMRIVGGMFFALCLQVNNTHQQYSATYVMNLLIAATVAISLMQLLRLVPMSSKPQVVIMRLLRRYGDSMIAVLDDMRWDRPRPQGWLARQRRNYHLRQLRVLPADLNRWIAALPGAATDRDGRAALVRLFDGLAVLSYQLSDLARLRATPAAPDLIALVGEDVRTWRLGIRQVSETMMSQPGTIDATGLGVQLDRMIDRLHERIAPVAAAQHTPAPQWVAHMQRVLSAYRGVSNALISAASHARDVAWDRLTEPRF